MSDEIMCDEIKYDTSKAEPIIKDMKKQHTNMVDLLNNQQNNSMGEYYATKGMTAILAMDALTSIRKIDTIIQLVEKVNNNLDSINENYETVLQGIHDSIKSDKGCE